MTTYTNNTVALGGIKLPRYAFIYLMAIGFLSLFQITLGANLLVLVAIDLVCLSALVPMTRAEMDPNDLLMIALSAYYGTFSLLIKSFVQQPVQMNLTVPFATSLYLVGGYGMIFLAYLAAGRLMTRRYPRLPLRRWTWLEKTYADQDFLQRFTLPVSAIALVMAIAISLFSHSVSEISNGLADSGGLSSLGALMPLLQLAFAMQLAMLTRRGNQADRALVWATAAICIGMTLLNNQKLATFFIVVTYAFHVLAFRIRLNPRMVILATMGAVLAFFYVVPLVHIVRSLAVEKNSRLSVSLTVLQEAHFSPFGLMEIEDKIAASSGQSGLAPQNNYIEPYIYAVDRFTLLMPIDDTVRSTDREPLGFKAFAEEMVSATLPKFVIGEHHLDGLPDQIAWRYSLADTHIIARLALGLLATGYGVGGAWGLLLLAPFIIFVYFVLIKWVCNGSLWQNPWAVFMASYVIFDGEADFNLIIGVFRSFIPLMLIAMVFAMLNSLLWKRKVTGLSPAATNA